MRAAAQGGVVTPAPTESPCSEHCLDVVQNDCLDMAAAADMNMAVM